MRPASDLWRSGVARVLGPATLAAVVGLGLAGAGAVPGAHGADAADTAAPSSSMRLLTPSTAQLRKTGHLVVRVRVSERGNGALVAVLQPGAFRTAPVVHGFPVAGRVSFTLRISRKARAALAGRSRVTVHLTLAVEDAAGNRARRTLKRVLRG